MDAKIIYLDLYRTTTERCFECNDDDECVMNHNSIRFIFGLGLKLGDGGFN